MSEHGRVEPTVVPPAVDETATGEESRRTRKDLLKAAGVAAGGALVVNGLLAPDASAANGDTLKIGNNDSTTNVATQATQLQSSGVTGLVVNNTSANGTAIAGTGNGTGSGLIGFASTNGGTGVFGTGGAYGADFQGSINAITLRAQTFAGSPSNAVILANGGQPSLLGDMLIDNGGVLWMCINSGVASSTNLPGTWIKVSHGGSRPLNPPVRAYDTRTNPAGALRAGSGDTGNPRIVQITGVVAGVPSNAVGVSGNLAVTQEAASGGFATIWPSGAWPGTANINFGTADISNSFSVGLSSTGTISIAASAQTHAIIDISGYIL